ncbi:hypothetical protein ACFFWC_07705 [Plantactinospora siamensis]|uniref:Uncharacterized protein n=1 Tax=Plantactinospora siamensis TaxID=555372 RepID=A0ABV6NXI1_9ACTN
MDIFGPAVFWLVGILGLIAAIAGGRVVAGGVHLPPLNRASERIAIGAVSTLALALGFVLLLHHDPGPVDRAVEPAPRAAAPPDSSTPTGGGVAAPEGSTAAESTSSSAPASAGPDVVRWHGTLGIKLEGHYLDEIPPKPAGSLGDLAFSSNTLYNFYPDAGIARWTGAKAPTRQACSDLLDTHPANRVENVRPGVRACVRTAQNRVATARVLSVSDDVAEVDITVWELP